MGEQVAAGFLWGCSSVGRAPALQAGGQEFESLHLHADNEESSLSRGMDIRRISMSEESEAFRALRQRSKTSNFLVI